MEYLGAIANQKPSEIISTGFPLKPEMQYGGTVKLCIRAQPIE